MEERISVFFMMMKFFGMSFIAFAVVTTVANIIVKIYNHFAPIQAYEPYEDDE